MIVYREGTRERLDPIRELSQLETAPSALTRLIDAGELECAIADAESPERDAETPLSRQLRDVTIAAARAWMEPGDPHKGAAVTTLLRQLDTRQLPNSTSARVSEGFAYYALYPETFAASANIFHEAQRPARVCVVGIRSIGTTLSAVVAAALERRGCPVRSVTVRPRGHPWARTLALDASMTSVLKGAAADGCLFAVVDEGPGISGTSFASVATTLAELGIARERIALFPSWDPAPETLTSAPAQQVWREHRRYCTAAADAGITPQHAFGCDEPAIDFSAGEWRRHVYRDSGEWPAIHPQHERWKTFVPRSRRLFKFAGLGRYGAAARARALSLADLGLGAVPGELRQGFLDLPFIDGVPVRELTAAADLQAIGTYVGRVARAFPTGTAVDGGALEAMIEHNLRDVMGGGTPLTLPRDVQAVAIDGRMLPQEWLRTPHGLVKIDALDHSRDHFFPGPQSPAWDLAAAILEFDLGRDQADVLLRAFERESGERQARTLLPFYSLAYIAFRYGYATLAADTLRGTEDGRRFERWAKHYSQCALNVVACSNAASKSPRKQIARSSMKT